MSTLRISRFALVLAGAVVLASTAAAAPSLQFVSGFTSLRLSRQMLNALTAANITTEAVLPGAVVSTEAGTRVVLPVTTGDLDSQGPVLEILHSGGLTLTAAGAHVALTSFVIENLDDDEGDDSVELTGVVKVNDSIMDRLDLFNVELTQAPVMTPGAGGLVTLVTINGANLTLSEEGADALNSAFGLSGVFTQGFPVGTARVVGRIRDRDG